MPFREAHELVGRIVLYAQDQGRELWELTPDEVQRFSALLDAAALEATTPAGAVAGKRSAGGTAPERVARAAGDRARGDRGCTCRGWPRCPPSRSSGTRMRVPPGGGR